MIKFLMSIFKGSGMSYEQRQIERYLANSSDLIDLENRQREITHGRFKL